MAVLTRETFLGCVLGQAAGDALGAPFEGLTSDIIYHSFGAPRQIVAQPPADLETIYYTDDTQMMIGITETLIAHGHIDVNALAAAFGRHYDPNRGYGSAARKIVEAVLEGGDWNHLAETILPGGSCGNGAAMRAAPIGLFFHDDLPRLLKEAAESALPTHRHALGIEGGQLLALAVALATKYRPFDHDAFFDELLAHAVDEEFRWQLRTAAQLTADDSLALLGNSLEAHRSVVTAITCFAINPTSYPDTIARALSLGNDVDTLMAMAGAISGAHLGIDAVPRHLLDRLERTPEGYDFLVALAEKLHAAYRQRVGG